MSGNTSLRSFASSYIGFERLFAELEHMFSSSVLRAESSYPPTNISKTEDGYLLELAVAGFKKNEISVEHDRHRGTLTISGKKVGTEEKQYEQIVRGISARQFVRQLTLTDDINVSNASLEDGILTINLKKAPREEEKPLLIAIN
jgi:molecular chaperone IbpA